MIKYQHLIIFLYHFCVSIVLFLWSHYYIFPHHIKYNFTHFSRHTWLKMWIRTQVSSLHLALNQHIELPISSDTEMPTNSSTGSRGGILHGCSGDVQKTHSVLETWQSCFSSTADDVPQALGFLSLSSIWEPRTESQPPGFCLAHPQFCEYFQRKPADGSSLDLFLIKWNRNALKKNEMAAMVLLSGVFLPKKNISSVPSTQVQVS